MDTCQGVCMTNLFGNMNMAVGPFGEQTKGVLQTHGPSQCSGEFCSIHNPSDHPLRNARLNWRGDRGFMERICEHGIGHPDPDGLDHLKRTLGDRYKQYAFGIHGCDGCCRM